MIRCVCSAVLAGLAVGGVLTGPAQADESPARVIDGGGSDVVLDPNMRTVEPGVEAEMADVVEAYLKMRSQHQPLDSGEPDAKPTVDPDSRKVLDVPAIGQVDDIYCGPASGVMIISFTRGAGYTSRLNGSKLNQINMGSSEHMSVSGGTDRARKEFIQGMNRWEGITKWVQYPAPTATEFKAILTSRVGNSVPIAADTVEFPGLSHYNAHPQTGRAIGHWIVARGFDNYGDRTYFNDPSFAVWGKFGVQKRFVATTDGFVRQYLQSNGIAYK